MKWAFVVLILAVMGFIVTGCNEGSVTSPYQGNYTGSFNTDQTTGTLSGTISNSGHMTATLHNNTTGADATVTGGIANNGFTQATIAYPDQAFSVSGSLLFGQNQHLAGTLQQFQNGVKLGLVSVDLVKE